MSIWGDITHAVDSIPGAQTINKVGGQALGDIGHFIGSQKLNPFPHSSSISSEVGDVGKAGGAIQSAVAGGSTPVSSGLSTADNLLEGLGESQLQDPNSKLLTQLSGLLSGMSGSDAQKFLASKGITGTPLASELGQVEQGDPISQVLSAHEASVNPNYANQQNQQWQDATAGMLGQVFNNTIAPYVQNLDKSSNQQFGGDISAMQQALKGASPATQAAFKGIPQEFQAAEDLTNKANNEMIASGPQWSDLLNALTSQTQAYNAAKLIYGVAPYYSQTIAGNAPTNIPGALGVGGILPPTLGATPTP